MKCSAISVNIVRLILSIFFLTLLGGCSGDLNNTKKDPIFEKWSTLAENSQGHSPAARPKTVDLSSLSAKQVSSALSGTAVKKLPDKKINLSMRQAELKSVLRALARSVDLNIIVKNDVKGDINVDFRGIRLLPDY